MDAEQSEAKLRFISAFFDDMEKRIQRLHRMLESDFREEAFILACCYIDSLAFFRKGNDAKRDDFVRLIFDYSGRMDLFTRVSWPHLYNRGKEKNDKDSSGTPIVNYTQIRAFLLDRFGETCDHNNEVDKEGLIKLFKERGLKLDYQNLKPTLTSSPMLLFSMKNIGHMVFTGGALLTPGITKENQCSGRAAKARTSTTMTARCVFHSTPFSRF